MICRAVLARGRGRNRRTSCIFDAAGLSALKLRNIFLGQTLRTVVLLAAPEQFAQRPERCTESSGQTAVRFFWLLRGRGLDIRIMQIYSSGAEHIPVGKSQGQ